MRRADRLFQIVQILRNRRTVTAAYLAERLEVSERTIYRDIQDLSLSGIPIEGEAGVGYMLRHSVDIPPLMFNEDEIQAIVLGARMVKTWGGKALAQAAQQAIDKVEGVLPESLKHLTTDSHVYALPYEFGDASFANLDELRVAINKKLSVQFDYVRNDGTASQRKVNPLALYFWGKVWTLTSWCHLRQGFRNFRIDRMSNIASFDKPFVELPGQTLDDYIEIMRIQVENEWSKFQGASD